MGHGIRAILSALIILALTAFVDNSDRSGKNAQVRAEVSASAADLARRLIFRCFPPH